MFTDSALTTLNQHLTTIDGLTVPFQNRALLVLKCANAALAKIAEEGAAAISSEETSSASTNTSIQTGYEEE